jgi:hypothetical protein
MAERPVLPYDKGTTSGWSGTQTSRSAEPGRRGAQQQALDWLNHVGAWGSTWAEFADAAGIHHGTASGALSVLDQAGKVVLLAERRGKSHVYVLPAYQEGRPLAWRRRKGPQQSSLDGLRQMVESLEQTIEEQGDTIVALRSELRGFRDQQAVLNDTRRKYEALEEQHEELKRRLGDTLVARLMDEETP